MDIITINQKIFENIKLLRKVRDQLKVRAEDKAQAVAEYEKAMAVAVLRLRNGEAIEFEGRVIESPPVSIIRELAKGICYKESIAKDLAEANYRNALIAIENIRTEINAYQSILKYTEEVTE